MGYLECPRCHFPVETNPPKPWHIRCAIERIEELEKDLKAVGLFYDFLRRTQEFELCLRLRDLIGREPS